jgi:hypothetical protein
MKRMDESTNKMDGSWQKNSSKEGEYFRSVQNTVHGRGFTSLMPEDKKAIKTGFKSGKNVETTANSIVGRRSW